MHSNEHDFSKKRRNDVIFGAMKAHSKAFQSVGSAFNENNEKRDEFWLKFLGKKGGFFGKEQLRAGEQNVNNRKTQGQDKS